MMMRGEPLIQKIESHLKKQEWNEIITICQSAIAQDPNYLQIYPFLAKAYTQQGKSQEAIAVYEQILNTQLDQAEINAELGRLYSKEQKLEQAAWYYQQALALRPNWAELQYNLGTVLQQLGNWDMAIAAYQKALTLKPNYAAIYFKLGILHDRQGKPEIAIENYTKAIELQPDFIGAYNLLGSTLVKQKEYQAAIAVFQEGLKIDPTWASLHNNIGKAYWLNQQLDLALKNFEYAIALEPTMALAHHNLGQLWQQQGNYQNAMECLRSVIALEPNNTIAYSNYAETLLRLGKLKSVLDCWRRAINLQSVFVRAYCQRALKLEPTDLLNRVKISCAKFLTALEQQEAESEILEHLKQTYVYFGDILVEYGGFQQAGWYYQQALQIDPYQVDLYLRLGNCLVKQKSLTAAITVYQMGLTLQPDEPKICLNLEQLEQKQESKTAKNYHFEDLLNPQPPKLPQAIYHRTQDWVHDCQLEDFSYMQVVWGQNLKPTGTIIGDRQPQVIADVESKKQPDINCAGVNCPSCMQTLIGYFSPIQLDKKAYQCSFATPPPVTFTLPFVTVIPNGRAWIVPQKNDWSICNAIAIITPDGYLLGDLSRYYPWWLPGCPYRERTNHNIYQAEEIAQVEQITGKVAVLSGLAGHVYYHWMFDILPRIEIIRRSGIDLNTVDWFVVNNIDRDFQRETLQLLEIPDSKILISDRHTHFQATELIVPSFPGDFDWVPPGTIEFLRQTFLPQINSIPDKYGTKIYISRAKAKNRQIINEPEVIDLLSQWGFQTVYLEEISVLEQVAIFARAKVIVAAHGSGLTNLVFCSPNTTIVELFSPNYLRTDYWILSQQLKLQHYYSMGENFDCLSLRQLMHQNSLTEDILVDIQALKLILNTAAIAR
ncbi:MAG: tetratricopeptide repeat protein [Pleurocapsa sp.]